ncbi:10118_t:CDS:2 [Cetraspora pellucida]|uniref:10118_t:CDS:1 n=1 Tax=Cetraspora pellucida TaxID=1433469 RepID=A0A9N9BMT4_9GLOM|nr:10118_t:CDS:2 [Cetraspora pellucida]
MQRGNYDNVHQRCGDFVIDIEPYNHVTSYNTGGTATMSTNFSSQPSTTLFTATSPTTFTNKLRELESHNRYQSDQLKSILWERDDLKHRNHGLETKIKSLQDQINQSGQYLEECESLKNQNENLHNGIRQLQSMIINSNKERDDIRGRYQLLELYLNQMQNKLSDNEKLVLELNEVKNQNNVIMLENKNLLDEVDRLRENGDELTTNINNLQNELSIITKQRENTASAPNPDQIVDDEYKRLQNQCDELSSLGQNITKERDELSNLVQNITKERDELSNLIQSLTKERDELSNLVQNITKERDELSNLVQSITKERDELSNLVQNITKERDELSGLVQNITKERDELSGLVQNITKERDDYFNQVSDLSPQLSQLETELNVTRQQKDELTKNNNTLSSQLEQLQIKLDSIIQHRDEISNKNDTLISQLGRAQDELNQMINQQKDKDSLIDDVTRELNRMKEQYNTLNEQHDELQRQNHDLTFEQERLQTENERLQTELERLQTVSNNIVHQRDEFKVQNESIISEITMLKQQLETVSHNKAISQQIDEEFDNVRQRKDELSTENAALHVEVGRLRDLLNDLTVELERSRKGSNDLMQQRDGFKSINETLMLELSRIKHELDVENYSSTAEKIENVENINSCLPPILPTRSSTYPTYAQLERSRQPSSSNNNNMNISRSSTHSEEIRSPYSQNNFPSVTLRNMPQKLLTPQPLATTSNGTSEHMNESSEDSKVYIQEMLTAASLPTSPSQISLASNRTYTFTNESSEKTNRRSSTYNPSKPLPSVPTSGQRPKSFAFGLSNRKSLILSDKVTSSQSKIPKQVPICQQCLKNPCKKRFPKGYSKYCSSSCKSVAQKDSSETESQYNERRSSYSSSIFNGSTESFMKNF